MPSVEYSDLRQTALLWPKIGVDEYSQTVLGPLQELAPPNGVRWVEQYQQLMDPKGNETTLTGTVAVAQDIPIGSVMWLGTKEEWEGLLYSSSPDRPLVYGTGSVQQGELPELHEVRSLSILKDIKSRNVRRTLGLMRYKGKIPT